MYMSEDYNSPQSPYWAMKSFVALGLPETHAFWTAEEKPLPKENSSLAKPVKPPMHIVCNTGSHHYLLSAGQFCPWPLKATEAKYGKFAYSSHFGFSVPTGPLMPQMAPDSTLALSKDGGDTWRVPWKVHRHNFGTASLVHDNGEVGETIPTLKSSWKPWKDADVEVSTTLIPPCTRWPDWHIRIHEVSCKNGSETPAILAVQGGFAIQGRKANAGEVLPSFTDVEMFGKRDTTFTEGALQSSSGALVCSSAGASGIRPLNIDIESFSSTYVVDFEPEILKPDANTNLIWQRTLIPTMKGEMRRLSNGQTAVFVTGVFTVSRRTGMETDYDQLDIRARWEDTPVVVRNDVESAWAKTYISIGSD